MSDSNWKAGDRVRHPERPEWGVGTVTKAEPAAHQGTRCQRLTIRFELGGLKTLSTAFAKLRPADNAGEAQKGWLADLERKNPADRLATLPDDVTDPFSGPVERLRRTLQLYRFAPSGASLIDWAVMQTGLKDPLSELNRHELEDRFRTFRRLLDEHLAKVAREAALADAARTSELLAKAPADARAAVARTHGRR